MANAATGTTGQQTVASHTSGPVTTLAVADTGTVSLPAGVAASDCDIARDGQNLVLTSPDGHVFVVEGYFSLPDQPVLHDASGAVLTPRLVNAFAKTAGDVQLAATDQTSDTSPVGEVTETSGNATVTHADGSHEKITAGTKIYEGDIIETDAKGAVNIKFADDSTFAVSENARMSVDDFSYNPSDQHGSTGLSILRGVFMFTSGLVGRENPDAVHLNTPVGSIGIRGTIIGGHIVPDGQSQISVLEGAIVVRNGSGETILSQQFETVHLTGYNAPISNIGTLDATGISQSYNAVRGVSPALFTSIDDAAHDGARANGAPSQGTPDGTPATPDSAPETKQQTAPQDTTPPDATHNQQQGTQPQTAPSLDNTQQTVFQTLQTGSDIDNPLTHGEGVNTPAPQITPVNTLPPPPPVQPFTPPPAPVVEAPPQLTRDTRPPTAPLFVEGGSVAEESHAGTVVGRVGMSSDMPFPVTYTLVNDPDNVFAIDGATGVVTLKGYSGDSEAGMTHHDLIVRVTRNDTNQSAESPLTVNVLPVDETPHFNTGLTAQTASEGGYVVLTPSSVGATDPENAALTYTVTASAKGHIEVSGIAATTFTATQLSGGLVRYVHDGSEPGGASFTLTVSDTTGHTSDARQFSVSINPVNDAPQQVVSDGGTLAENGTIPVTAAQLSWSDPDNLPSAVVYTLTSS